MLSFDSQNPSTSPQRPSPSLQNRQRAQRPTARQSDTTIGFLQSLARAQRPAREAKPIIINKSKNKEALRYQMSVSQDTHHCWGFP